ncbi:MAG: hypothetical protein R3F37_09240 [Candidatus Competibacteraceae bacterium]
MNAVALPGKLLLCIYTCEADRFYLEQLQATQFYARINAAESIDILEVFADPSLPKPVLQGRQLTLNCPEEYRSLSIKTQAMLRYCYAHLAFDYLLKLDCTLVDYARRPSHRTGEQIRRIFNLDTVERLIFDPAFYASEYIGLYWQRATRDGVEQWARVKGLPPLDGDRIFGDRRELSYYAGKFYAIGRRFCGFIADYGQAIAEEHQRMLNGSEDLMVGRLYERYRQHDQS